jgi:hypothetical protein
LTTAWEQIRSADEAICQNIASLTDQRDLLSQNVLAQLRNLVEGVSVRLRREVSTASLVGSGEDAAVALEDVLALHVLGPGADADQQGVVDVGERDFGSPVWTIPDERKGAVARAPWRRP